MIAEETKKGYVSTGGHSCLYCGSPDLDTDLIRVRDYEDGFEQVVRCLHCNKRWLDVLGVTDVQEIDDDYEQGPALYQAIG
jgi:hypothetical protein